ncbi:hypothetical protein SmJEL517_g01724 [Synchytrium microbalum]|uniref:SANT domain-containing protein n=1 Tax=Synchytrium microbalum TaxID=1806994 RepID=A0A507C8V1_9FUNG|nr:uncharacterized protein SmJEL517_g01724 [Synchytrium microbalum]TPX35951.1 hypothetical protein SmJEL517_g01724 [Synchytrium microbalum]
MNYTSAPVLNSSPAQHGGGMLHHQPSHHYNESMDPYRDSAMTAPASFGSLIVTMDEGMDEEMSYDGYNNPPRQSGHHHHSSHNSNSTRERPSLLGHHSPVGSPSHKRSYDGAYDDMQRIHQRPRLNSSSRPTSTHVSPAASPNSKTNSPQLSIPPTHNINNSDTRAEDVQSPALGLVMSQQQQNSTSSPPPPDEELVSEALENPRPSVESTDAPPTEATEDEAEVDGSDGDFDYRASSPRTTRRGGSRAQIPRRNNYSAPLAPVTRGGPRRRGAIAAKISRFERYDSATMAARVPPLLSADQRGEPSQLEQRHSAIKIDDALAAYKPESAEAVLKRWTEEEIEQLDAGLNLLGPKGGAKAGHFYGAAGRPQYKSQDWLGAAAKAVPTKSTREVVQFYYMFRNKLPWWRARAADKYRRKMAVEDREYEKATASARDWAERCEDEIDRMARFESGGGTRRSERANAGAKRRRGKNYVEDDDDESLRGGSVGPVDRARKSRVSFRQNSVDSEDY